MIIWVNLNSTGHKVQPCVQHTMRQGSGGSLSVEKESQWDVQMFSS